MSDGQVILLTFLSVLELIVLLVALAFALRRIQTALDYINVNASKILWGVRAIEHETDPLPEGLLQLRVTLTQVVAGAGLIADGLASADQHLGQVADTLSGPRRR
jgi:uncharacterized protein YoxC